MKKAFTILELLVVIAVLTILITIGIPRFKGMQSQANIAKVKEELKAMQAAVESYYGFSNPRTYPPSSTTVSVSYLTQTAPQIISSALNDPFASAGTEYNYLLSSNGKFYIIWSLGPDTTNTITAISNNGGYSGSSSVMTGVDDIYVTNGPPKVGLGSSCSSATSFSGGVDCQSGYCGYNAPNGSWIVSCTDGNPGSFCSSGWSCKSNSCIAAHCQ